MHATYFLTEAFELEGVSGSGRTTQTVRVVNMPCSSRIKECAAWNDWSRAINTSLVVVTPLFITGEKRALFKYSMLPCTADRAAMLAFGPEVIFLFKKIWSLHYWKIWMIFIYIISKNLLNSFTPIDSICEGKNGSIRSSNHAKAICDWFPIIAIIGGIFLVESCCYAVGHIMRVEPFRNSSNFCIRSRTLKNNSI